MKSAMWKAAVGTDDVIHAAHKTNNNGQGRVGRRRRWPEPRQPGPDAGVILTNSTARNAEAEDTQTEARFRL